MLCAVCLALLALRRWAHHFEIDTRRLIPVPNEFTYLPRVGLQKVWTGRQEPIFTSRMKRRNLAESNKVHPFYVGLVFSRVRPALPSRPLPKLPPVKPRDRLSCSLTIFNVNLEPLHPLHIRMTSSLLHCSQFDHLEPLLPPPIESAAPIELQRWLQQSKFTLALSVREDLPPLCSFRSLAILTSCIQVPAA